MEAEIPSIHESENKECESVNAQSVHSNGYTSEHGDKDDGDYIAEAEDDASKYDIEDNEDKKKILQTKMKMMQTKTKVMQRMLLVHSPTWS